MHKSYWLWGLLLALLPILAPAQPLSVALEQLPDAKPPAVVLSGQADADFVPVAGSQFVPPRAYSDYWLRVELPASVPDEQLVLAVRRVPIDHITLYRRAGDGAWQPIESGTLSTNDQLPFNVCCFGFALPRQAQAHDKYLLHVEDSSPTGVIVRLQTWREFAERDRLETVIVALVLGTLLAMFAVNALFYIVLRDVAYLHISIYQVCMAIYLAYSADLFHSLPDDMGIGMRGKFPWLIAAGLASSFSASFIQRFVNLAAHWPRFSKVMDVMRYTVLGITLLVVLPFESLAEYVRQGFNGMLLVLAVFSGLTPVLAFKYARRPASFVLVGWVIYVLLVSNRISAAMGVGSLDAFAQYAFQIGSGLLAVVLTIGLADRTLELRQQRDRAQFLRDQALKRLNVERTRRALVDGLADLVKSGGSDLAFTAFKRMLTALGKVMPLDTAAVLIEGADGKRILVADPAKSQDAYSDLIKRRGPTLRSIGQSQRALVLGAGEGEHALGGESSTAVVPMPGSADRWGVVLLSRPKWQEFGREEFDLVSDFIGLVGKAVDEAQQQAELKQQASFDALTGALNRGNIESLLESGFEQSVLQRQGFSVLFIDLDYFKRVNDEHGHSTGDECLIAVAQRLARTIGAGHALGRYGGEEFLVLLPQTSDAAARQLAERLRVAINGEPVVAGAVSLTLTVSIGGASRQPGEISPRVLLERADQALYQAKRSGRNRVIWADGAAAQIA